MAVGPEAPGQAPERARLVEPCRLVDDRLVEPRMVGRDETRGRALVDGEIRGPQGDPRRAVPGDLEHRAHLDRRGRPRREHAVRVEPPQRGERAVERDRCPDDRRHAPPPRPGGPRERRPRVEREADQRAERVHRDEPVQRERGGPVHRVEAERARRRAIQARERDHHREQVEVAEIARRLDRDHEHDDREEERRARRAGHEDEERQHELHDEHPGEQRDVYGHGQPVHVPAERGRQRLADEEAVEERRVGAGRSEELLLAEPEQHAEEEEPVEPGEHRRRCSEGGERGQRRGRREEHGEEPRLEEQAVPRVDEHDGDIEGEVERIAGEERPRRVGAADDHRRRGERAEEGQRAEHPVGRAQVEQRREVEEPRRREVPPHGREQLDDGREALAPRDRHHLAREREERHEEHEAESPRHEAPDQERRRAPQCSEEGRQGSGLPRARKRTTGDEVEGVRRARDLARWLHARVEPPRRHSASIPQVVHTGHEYREQPSGVVA